MVETTSHVFDFLKVNADKEWQAVLGPGKVK